MIAATGKPARALILVMMTLAVITILFSLWHYRRENLSADPRVVPARKLYEGYNALTRKNDFAAVIRLLDSIDNIYSRYPHYHHSFETGVLENNRAAVYLTLGLSYDSLSSPFHQLGQDSLISLGESAVRNSIYIYEKWMDEYSGKNAAEIREQVKGTFLAELNRTTEEKDLYLNGRVEEIQAAVKETPRRLSVSYTNLGIVYRYREDYQGAAASYQKAMDLWEDNLTAENNLNILLDRPMKKRNFIQKMFPKSGD